MKKVIPIVIVIVFIGTSLLAYRYFNREKPFVLSGSIEARDADVGSLVGGRVTAIHVKEGEAVKAGQPLVTLDSDLLNLQILEQESNLAEARAQLARVQKGPRSEELSRARIDWENAERDRQRMETLSQEGVVSTQAYDQAKTKAENAQQYYRELDRGSRIEDIRAAQAAVAREEGRLAYMKRQLKETVILAPSDGIVESLELRPGDLLAANQSAVRILEHDQVWVRVYVPEPSLGLVKKGQKVGVTVDTFPGRRFDGVITEINQQGEYTPRNVQTLDQRFDQVFGVKVSIPNAPELKPGMAALVQLGPGVKQ